MIKKAKSAKPKKRIPYIDTAKAIGIFLVFYGHLVEEFAGAGNQIAFTQYKFIFSFHMPFFFFLAGFFYRRRYPSLWQEIRDSAYKRLLPVLFFGLLLLPVWPIYRFLIWGYVDFPIFTEKVLPYLKGQPELNPITWFLVCLFVVEIMAALILPKASKPLWRIAVVIVFLGIGLYLTSNIKQTEILFGVYKNTWFVHEALVAFGFYALGYYLFPSLRALLENKALIRFVLMIFFTGILLATFNLNTPYPDFAVIMKESWHGNSVWFFVSALSGAMAILFLATFIPKHPAIDYIGRNTLILLGINGFFHIFVNPHISARVKDFESFGIITLTSLLGAALSIIISIPVIWFFNKYLPQFIGHPYKKGPWLSGFKP